ncbi:MAG: oligosaccharide flippase family protein [Fulvivirga sp.]|uniref:lipopolysaccharide biosynthesis protein n=1 Tax=Fulvivirga sp. TaxID=1931237 RepID=UPI0032F06E3A
MIRIFNDIYQEVRKISAKGTFAQNVSIVFTGNILNLILQILVTPIVSRIFGPDSYGEYAYFNLIVTNISFFAAFSIPSIYIIPKSRFEFLALAKFVMISITVTMILTIGVYTFASDELTYGNNVLGSIAILIILILINNFNGILESWNIRIKRFKRNTAVSFTSNIFSKGGTIAYGLILTANGTGLLFGDLIKGLITFFTQTTGKTRLIIIRFLFRKNGREVLASLKKNLNVPKFVFPSQLISKWTGDIPILIIGWYYSKEVLGNYIFAITILNIPKNLIANAIRPVLFQKANEVYNETPQLLGSYFIKSLTWVFMISAGFTVIIIPVIPLLFPFVFGDQWQESGLLIPLVSSYYMMMFIITPYIDFWRIIKKERELLYVNIVSTIFKLVPFAFIFLQNDFNEFLIIYSIFSSVGILILVWNLLTNFFGFLPSLKIMVMLVIGLSLCYIWTLFISEKLINSF